MIRARSALNLAVAGAALALAGCISLLPKSQPAQLYRFGATAPPKAAAPSLPAVNVFWANGSFQPESADERILALTGPKAAYIAQSRWVAPARVLFEEAVQAAFDAKASRVKLVPRGGPVVTDSILRLDVRDFETRYDAGAGAAPTVLVRVHAMMTHDRNRSSVSEEIFEARAPASDNRVTAIVAAYDKALDQVLDRLIAWADRTAA